MLDSGGNQLNGSLTVQGTETKKTLFWYQSSGQIKSIALSSIYAAINEASPSPLYLSNAV